MLEFEPQGKAFRKIKSKGERAMNQYPHHGEMKLVLETLQEIIKFSEDNPWEAILDFKECSSEEDRNAWINLNDLEEAVVLKNFGSWYQQEYTHNFPNGRGRL